MNPGALRLAAELGGTVLSGEGGELVAAERVRAHGLPQLLVLGRGSQQLLEPLEAWEASRAPINLTLLLPAPGAELARALLTHRRRIGSLVAALDAGLPWLEGRPMLAKRLPGRIFSANPRPLDKAPLGPMEKEELKAFLPDWSKEARRAVFRRPEWEPVEGGFEARLWPGVALPENARLLLPPLPLPTASALMEALRGALRQALGRPIPLLPLPEDASALHALRSLSPQVAPFHGPAAAWELAFQALSRLPAPPHFCARC